MPAYILVEVGAWVLLKYTYSTKNDPKVGYGQLDSNNNIIVYRAMLHWLALIEENCFNKVLICQNRDAPFRLFKYCSQPG